MGRFVLQRLLFGVLSIMGATFVVFALSRVAGDPRNLYLTVGVTTEEVWEQWGRDFGLDKPLVIQYVIYLGKLVRGDLGDSILQRRSVTELMWQRMPNSAQLAVVAFAFSIIIGIPLGILSAVTRGSAWDYISRSFAMFGHAAPSFWVGIVLIFIFAVGVEISFGLFDIKTDWFPTSRKEEGLRSFILPAVTLGWASAGGQLRLMRSSMLEVLDAEYIKLARAKGASRYAVILKHAVRNAFIAPLTYAGLTLAGLVTGTIVVETVFAWPGLGLLSIWAVNNSDYPILQGIILLVTFAFVLTAFATDVLYAFLDPRIRFR